MTLGNETFFYNNGLSRHRETVIFTTSSEIVFYSIPREELDEVKDN